MPSVTPLPPAELYTRADPDQFSFQTTAELEDLQHIIGQERAMAAIRFGIGMDQDGYNLFAFGPNGVGKYTAVRRSLEAKAAGEPLPDDWAYVYNFEQPFRPNALRLPAGEAVRFEQEMKRLVDELFDIVPAAFESEEFHNQRRSIESEFQERQEAALVDLREDAQKQDIALIRTPSGLAFAPLRNNEVIKPEDFLALPEDERKRIEGQIEQLQERLQTAIRQLPQWVREGRARVKELQREVAAAAVAPLVQELRDRYAGLPEVLAHLDAAQQDIIERSETFLDSGDGEGDGQPGLPAAGERAQARQVVAGRYRVNVIVDQTESAGAPIIYEQNPTYQNLIGRVEYLSQMGALVTDFNLIKAGALHRANGGYLILDAHKILSQPFAWEGLKRALRSEKLAIESPAEAVSLISTVSLEPEPIPLDVKVVLLGERQLYYLMVAYDPDFGELFKVAADFADDMDRDRQGDAEYARLIATMARKEGLRPFDRQGVARVIEHGARLVADSEKLTAHMQRVADLLREADYWAREAAAGVVSDEHVQQAIDAQIYRASRLRERLQEEILRETYLIDTSGEKIGQINGLSVMSYGDYAFGRPSRITARVYMGKGEVIDIERQVELGGPLHSKGVLILASYLGSHYAAERPLSLNASLVFEQSYSGVDGDSASSAELYALLSAMANAPIKQSLAVTGSVNQHGEVQAIGGVNEKIEGYFDICQARGLSGEQGVLIPAANVKHLMLRSDVVQAAAEGRFAIYPIETIEQGIELLTGVPAGELDVKGVYPEGSINRRIMDRLDEVAEKQREYGRPPETESEGDPAKDEA
jgi:lon-related putative ATP-dependent protease